MCNSYVFDGWRYGCKEDWKNETFLVLKWRDGVRTFRCIKMPKNKTYVSLPGIMRRKSAILLLRY